MQYHQFIDSLINKLIICALSQNEEVRQEHDFDYLLSFWMLR